MTTLVVPEAFGARALLTGAVRLDVEVGSADDTWVVTVLVAVERLDVGVAVRGDDVVEA